MANEEHLARLRKGVKAWNAWREEHPHIVPDLSGTDLQRANFKGANFKGANFNGADLSGANLSEVDLSFATLSGAYLIKADFSFATLIRVGFRGADLSLASLGGARLSGTDFSEAILKDVEFSLMDLSGVNFIKAILIRADFSKANLSRVNLCDADLRQASLIDSRLDGANLTGAKLWETQRGGWSIKGVTCPRAFWDRNGKEPTEYGVGDFERIFAEKVRIVLRYPGGLSLVELAMLPLIIERLQVEHPDCALHIRSVQDDGTGATVTITVEDITNRDSDTFRHEVDRLQSELKYMEGQRDLYRDQFMPIFRELVIRSGQTIIGKITNPAVIEGSMSRDTYNISGQAGAVGPDAHAHDMTFQQIQNSLDLSKLAEELGRLRSVMKQETEGTREQDKAVAAVAEAEEAAIKGDGPTALRHLRTAGKWALGIAEKIGVSVAADAIKKALGPLAGS
jgi:uncharacterized protein YjbI with pentapeptide repeats